MLVLVLVCYYLTLRQTVSVLTPKCLGRVSVLILSPLVNVVVRVDSSTSCRQFYCFFIGGYLSGLGVKAGLHPRTGCRFIAGPQWRKQPLTDMMWWKWRQRNLLVGSGGGVGMWLLISGTGARCWLVAGRNAFKKLMSTTLLQWESCFKVASFLYCERMLKIQRSLTVQNTERMR